MPQLIQFPFLAPGDPSAAVDALVQLCHNVPVDGEPFKDFRARLRSYKMWDKARVVDTLRFLRMAKGDLIVPSLLMRQIATAENNTAAREVIAERLWLANPILFKTVCSRLAAEKVYPPGEMYTFLDSSAYRGEQIPRVQLESWMWLARGLNIIKILGIAFALDERGQQYLSVTNQLNVDEFLEEDEAEEEPEPTMLAGASEADDEVAGDQERETAPMETASAAISPAARSKIPAIYRPARAYPSPHTGQPRVPVDSFASGDGFSDPVRAATSAALAQWWGEQEAASIAPSLADFAIDNERWFENPEESLYRLAVAAALIFRMGDDSERVKAVYAALDADNVLEDLYYGTAPESLSERVDPQALMLASLIARRCAEAPELEATLEKQESAAAAFAVLADTLGRGLFKMELFWMMRGLHELGALRFDDLADYTALPHRTVRDALFRLGFLATPYAHDRDSLVRAAIAARRLASDAPRADEVVVGFTVAAGCAYDCGERKRCAFACRERAEI